MKYGMCMVALIASVLLVASTVCAEDVLIEKFLLKKTRVFTGDLKCKVVETSELPNPEKEKVKVLNFDKRRALVMFENNGEELWVSQGVVKLNVEYVADALCGDSGPHGQSTTIARVSRKTYSAQGLGEGCK